MLYNGLGEYPAALDATRRAVDSGELFITGLGLSEPVKAAVRCGEEALARSALESLVERTEPAGTAFALGIAAGRGTGTVESPRCPAVWRLHWYWFVGCPYAASRPTRPGFQGP